MKHAELNDGITCFLLTLAAGFLAAPGLAQDKLENQFGGTRH